jgi:hypothetical protein
MDIFIEQLSRILMEAYAALPLQDQEGPLGEKISAMLHDLQRILFPGTGQAMKDTVNHSTRLFNGEIDTFLEACRAMIGQYRQEAHWIATTYKAVAPEDAAKRLADMERFIAAVYQCRQEYVEALRQMEQMLCDRWSANEAEIPQMLAEALHDGDYSRLAL